MTPPPLTERIALVLAECERQIKLAEKATAGPWRESKVSSIRVCSELPDGSARGVVAYGGEHCGTYIPTSEAYANTAFIAACRTFAPAAAVGIRDQLIVARAAGARRSMERLTSPFAYLWE